MDFTERNIMQFFDNFEVASSGCWVWCRSLNWAGYGVYNSTSAHRFSYLLFVEDIPENFDAHHLCNLKACVNPFHLVAISHGDNVRLQAKPSKWRSNYCKYGHPFDLDNTYFNNNGGRTCRKCQAERRKSKLNQGLNN